MYLAAGTFVFSLGPHCAGGSSLGVAGQRCSLFGDRSRQPSLIAASVGVDFENGFGVLFPPSDGFVYFFFLLLGWDRNLLLRPFPNLCSYPRRQIVFSRPQDRPDLHVFGRHREHHHLGRGRSRVSGFWREELKLKRSFSWFVVWQEVRYISYCYFLCNILATEYPSSVQGLKGALWKPLGRWEVGDFALEKKEGVLLGLFLGPRSMEDVEWFGSWVCEFDAGFCFHSGFGSWTGLFSWSFQHNIFNQLCL